MLPQSRSTASSLPDAGPSGKNAFAPILNAEDRPTNPQPRTIDIFTALVAIVDFIDNDLPKLRSSTDLKAALVIWRKTHGWGLVL